MAEFAFAERPIPPEVIECAKDHILDAIGVGIAAAALPGSERLHAAVRALGAGEDASVLGYPGRLPAPSAALLNGTFVHSLEYDDTHTASVVHAMGISGSQAGGVFEFLSEGATVKSMHPGWAAHAGLVAAELAAAGMTGPSTIFEGAHGFYRTYAGDPEAPLRLHQSLDSLGSRWLLLEASLKGYPCCHYIHPFLECAERLRAKSVAADAIESIECEVPEEEAMLICDPWERKLAPASGYDAKFSLPYVLAILWCDGRVGVETFAGAADHRAALALARRISWKPWRDSGFPRRFAAKLRVKLHSGESLEESVGQVRGSPERPFSRTEIAAKFEANAALRLGDAFARELRESILDLPAASPRTLLGSRRAPLEAA